MKAKSLLRTFCFSVITALSGMSAADDIDIYLDPGVDQPKGDVSLWPTLMLSFDLGPESTSAVCRVSVDYTPGNSTVSAELK